MLGFAFDIGQADEASGHLQIKKLIFAVCKTYAENHQRPGTQHKTVQSLT